MAKMHKKHFWQYLNFIAIILPYIIMIVVFMMYKHKMDAVSKACIVVISKEDMQLSVYSYDGSKKFEAPIAVGSGFGNKLEIGDRKTPEGVFHVIDVEDASTWGHDFKDGKGRIEGAYGPIFIRLSVPGQKGIGIHGTHDPNSIGTRATEGCIRLKNDDIVKLSDLVQSGTLVIIETSKKDVIKSTEENKSNNKNDTIKSKENESKVS
jgi:murein L,D-transpeptidase YafK